MRPKTFGRALGIGARFAGKALLEGRSAAPPGSASAQQARSAQAAERARAVRAAGERGRELGTDAGQVTRNVARGSRNFGRALWNPFAHATSVLWLEITGMFFALFVLFFAQHLYELRGAWRQGEEHAHFLLYAGLSLLFLYFSASSFARAHRKQARRG